MNHKIIKEDNLKFVGDIKFWSINDEWTAVFSANIGKVLCIPVEWEGLINKNCDNPTKYFDQETMVLFSNYGLFHTNNEENVKIVTSDINENKKLDTLSLVISEGCNFKCPHCIHSNDVAKLSTRNLNTYMSNEMASFSIDKFFAIARTNNQNEINIDFGAAEPLINWQAIEYSVNYIKNNYSDFSVVFHMTTNISLVTESQTKFFIENNFKLSTSLDGDKLANDAVRMDTKGNGTYDTIIEKINLMKKNGYLFDSVNLTLTKDNINIIDIENYLDTIKSIGMNGIGFDFDVVTSEHLSVETVCDKMLEIYDSCKKRELYCVGNWLHPAENMLNSEITEPNVFCKAVAGKNLTVSPQGMLHMCNFTSTPLGKIQQVELYGEHLNDLISNRKEFVENHCQKCDLKSSCAGQCHTTLEATQKEKIDFMCNFYRTLTKAVVIRCLNEQLKNETETEYA